MITASPSMDLIIGIYIGIGILAALLVVLTILAGEKSTAKNNITRTQEQPLEDMETSPALKKRYAPTLKPILNGFKFLSKVRLSGFKRKKRNVPSEQLPLNEAIAVNKRFSKSLPGVTSSETDVNAAPSVPGQRAPGPELGNESAEVNMVNTLPVDVSQEAPDPALANEDAEVNMANALPVDVSQETPDPELANEGAEVNMANALPVDVSQETLDPALANEGAEVNMANALPVDASQRTPDLEPPTEEDAEAPNEVSDNENQAQETTKDALLDLFLSEEAEESDVNKLAATLDNMDVHDVSDEARNLINQLKGTRK